MPNPITIPNPDVALINNDGKINSIWFQKFTEWLRKTNQDSLSTNGKLTVTATSNTNIRLSYVGTDGTTRTADITLS